MASGSVFESIGLECLEQMRRIGQAPPRMQQHEPSFAGIRHELIDAEARLLVALHELDLALPEPSLFMLTYQEVLSVLRQTKNSVSECECLLASS